MRLLIITPAYLPDTSKGGSVTGCHEFAKCCVSGGIHTNILTINTCQTRSKDVIDGVKITRVKHLKILDFLSKSGFGVSFDLLKHLYEHADKYDIIYFRSIWNFVSIFGPIICLLKRKKYGFCASGKLSEHALKQSRWKKLLALVILHFTLKRASFVHYATKQEHLEQSLPVLNRVKAIYATPSVSIVPNEICGEPVVYTVSRIHRIKNIEYIIRSLNNLNEKLCIFGDFKQDENYYTSLKELAKEQSYPIHFEGYSPRYEVDANIPLGSIFVLASHSEGLSNAALEALARGSVVMVSKGARMNDFMESGSVIEFDTSDPDSLRSKFEHLRGSDLKSLGLNSKSYVHTHLSMKNIGNTLMRQFLEI